MQDDIKNYSLVIVGTIKGNSILKKAANYLPFKIKNKIISYNHNQVSGTTVALSFIYPNPLNPKRYIVVHTGTTVKALKGAITLPQLLPDYVIYDSSKAKRSRGYIFGNDRPIIDGGFFDTNWQF